jgi:hypothetical protein
MTATVACTDKFLFVDEDSVVGPANDDLLEVRANFVVVDSTGKAVLGGWLGSY